MTESIKPIASPQRSAGERVVNVGTDARRQMRTIAVGDDKLSMRNRQPGGVRKESTRPLKPADKIETPDVAGRNRHHVPKLFKGEKSDDYQWR